MNASHTSAVRAAMLILDWPLVPGKEQAAALAIATYLTVTAIRYKGKGLDGDAEFLQTLANELVQS